jgi:UDP-N-acetylmuramate: L-alanyl-gamma-D-glutamyl-meso-diaminopimelate ligase
MPSITRFKVRRSGELFGQFESPLLGIHNVRNALVAIAVGSRVGLDASQLAGGLKSFKGIKRRLETVGVRRDVTVLDDFAHHPTAVHETLAALRTGYPSRRLWAVFEPRSASSCRRVFQDDFAAAFGAADEVVIAGVFRSSLPESERLSPEVSRRPAQEGRVPVTFRRRRYRRHHCQRASRR